MWVGGCFTPNVSPFWTVLHWKRCCLNGSDRVPTTYPAGPKAGAQEQRGDPTPTPEIPLQAPGRVAGTEPILSQEAVVSLPNAVRNPSHPASLLPRPMGELLGLSQPRARCGETQVGSAAVQDRAGTVAPSFLNCWILRVGRGFGSYLVSTPSPSPLSSLQCQRLDRRPQS